MFYNNDQIIQAFKLYTILSAKGYGEKEELRLYLADDAIRGLVDQFAKEVDCTIFASGDYIYMIPISKNSIFHVSNESIKNDYLPGRAVNLDIYIMYLSIIILLGEFYDSYQTVEPTRDFISTNEWLLKVNERVDSLKEQGEEKLKDLDKEFEYNWTAIVKAWNDMDDIKEKVKSQDGRTISRKSFLNVVKQFLEKQDLIKDIGNEELELSEKAKTIVQRYYMEFEYNRGILDFIYSLEQKKGGE